MRYYTDELRSGVNNDSKEERVKEDLHGIKMLMSMLKYLKEHAFHDYQLKNLKVVHGVVGYKYPVEVSIVITDGFNSWNIVYKKIKKISINYEHEIDNSKRRKYRGFDDYGYDEFFQINEKTFSHEIFFASGATILIHFEKIHINKITIE